MEVDINKRKFNGFISYRHTEPDMTVAKELEHKLERFKLPYNLRKKFPKDKWKIARIFRDQDELPLADSLSEQIETALSNSEFLIVICSPRYNASEWCAKEVDYFEKNKGLDRILLVLIEGEPEQSFPPEVFTREKKVINAQGEEETIIEDVEPLAADVRADNPRLRSKKIDDAVLRLAAPMFGLGYDDLRQRHREQKIRRIASICGLCSAVFFVFAVVCLLLFMKISTQKDTIEEQKQNLQVQYNIVSDQKSTIEEQKQDLQNQYRAAQVNHAASMSQISKTLVGLGRRKDAVYALRHAMPSSMNDETVPYVPSAHRALSDYLYEYDSDIFVDYEIMDLPEDESYWGYFDEYMFLQEYMGGQTIVGCGEWDENTVLIISDTGDLYLFGKNDYVLGACTSTFLPDRFSEHVVAAIYSDGDLYIRYNKCDYMVRFRIQGEAKEVLDTLSREEYREFMSKRGHMLEEDEKEEVRSDDGKYRMILGSNHSIAIYKGDEAKEVNTIYDIKGETYAEGFIKLQDTPLYALLCSDSYAYILDENANMEIIGRFANFYGYSPERKEVLLFRRSIDKTKFEIYGKPIKTYDEIIKDADEFLGDYRPTKEIINRYGIEE